jgi:hypothetical protein
MNLFQRETPDWSRIVSDAGWPVTACASCGVLLSPISKRRAARAFNMVLLRYVCERCEFETFRTAKAD